MKRKVEVLIFAKNWDKKELLKELKIKEDELIKIINEINEELKNRPYFIKVDDNMIYFTVKDEYLNLVKKYLKPVLSKEEIEVLTMIVNNFSYSDIIRKKGKKGKSTLEKLEKEGWIKIKKKDRKYIFVLTQKFKEHFKIDY